MVAARTRFELDQPSIHLWYSADLHSCFAKCYMHLGLHSVGPSSSLCITLPSACDGVHAVSITLKSEQVLQLPIVKNKVKKLLQGAVKKLPALGAPVIPSSDDNLEDFLQAAGRFFGRDPAKWDQVGEQTRRGGRGGTPP